MARNGKIARLPLALRRQLNQRLADGEPGTCLLQWLNSLPKVQAVMAGHFKGQPINEPNLTQWREGGFQDWLIQDKSLEAVDGFVEAAAEIDAPGGTLTDRLALVLSTRITAALRRFDGSGIAPEKLCAQLVALRRGDQFARFLDLQAQRVEIERQATQPGMEKKFLEWATQPENQQKFCPNMLSREEQRRRARKILEIWDPRDDLPAETMTPPPEAQDAAPGELNQIKPNEDELNQAEAQNPEPGQEKIKPN